MSIFQCQHISFNMMHHWAYFIHFISSFGSKMYLCMVPYLHWPISCSNFLFIWWTVCDHQILHIYSVCCHSVILCRTPPLGADPPAPRCGPMPAKRIQWSMTLFHQVPTGMTLAHLSSWLVHQKDVLITYLMEKNVLNFVMFPLVLNRLAWWVSGVFRMGMRLLRSHLLHHQGSLVLTRRGTFFLSLLSPNFFVFRFLLLFANTRVTLLYSI